MPLFDPQPRRVSRRLVLLAAFAVTFGVSSAAQAYDAIRPWTPLAARLAELARRTGQPLAPMLAAPDPWLPPAPDPAAVEAARARTRNAERDGNSTVGSTPNPIAFADAYPSSRPFPIAVGDFNGDGRADLLNYGPAGGPALALATADDFATPVEYPIPAPWGALNIGDVDGDGRLDVVSWCAGAGIVVLRGHGDGTLAPAVVSPLAGAPSSIALADVDGDGHADVVALEKSDSTLIVARGAGDGTFLTAERFATAEGAFQFTLGDFNGDGRADVAVICWPTSVEYGLSPTRALSVRLGQGSGLLGERHDYTLPRMPRSVISGDLDGDGRSELLVGWRGWSGFELHHASPDGSFDSTSPHPMSSTTRGEAALAIADMDHDGRPEIVATYTEGDGYDGHCLSLAIFSNDGSGVFSDSTAYLAIGAGFTDRNGTFDSILAADFDGDHGTDLLIGVNVYPYGTYSPQPATVLLRRRGPTLLAPSRQLVGSGPYALGAGRFRPGALRDLVTSGCSTVGILRNRGDGSFLPPQDLEEGALAAVTDLNHDGLDDIVIARGVGTLVRLADGSGGFGPPVEYFDGNFLDAADFLGHGFSDIAVAPPGGTVHILPNDGTGHFGPAVDFGASFPGATLVRAADLDGDGRADLVMAAANYDSQINDSLAVFWNRGDGFLPPDVYDIGSEYGGYSNTAPPSDIKVGDFDGDGKPDIVVTKGTFGRNDASGTIQVLRNLGGRAFGPRIERHAGVDPWDSAIADFDGDGLEDIAVADVRSSDTGRISLFRGLGDGAVVDEWRPFLTEHYPTSVVAADFDGDNRPDLAVGCLFPHSVLMYPNVSPPPLSTPVLASLINRQVWSDRVSLTWLLSSIRSTEITVERRAPSDDWTAFATAPVDGVGHVAFEDRAVAPGARYGYRLRVGRGALAITTAENWIDVPELSALMVTPAGANPARHALRVAFALPGEAPARLDLFDLSGRRVGTRRLTSTGAGRREVAFDDGALGAGLYFVTLTQGARTASTRIALIR